jgi:hypothetical protein
MKSGTNMLPPKILHENEKPLKVFEPLKILLGFFMSKEPLLVGVFVSNEKKKPKNVYF